MIQDVEYQEYLKELDKVLDDQKHSECKSRIRFEAALAAMQGVMACDELIRRADKELTIPLGDFIAMTAVKLGDRLLAELEKTFPPAVGGA